ncbi:trypsin-like peptidase domain-containing protein [Fodinisporobacter ferrooxydans]|uniref:Trypsin-like peptidase domain-containing protein n=1 Tax=Fodinisporobacter ferrooxydans TaxID=2901836 RepID=A0ABY4CF28_9BACL|nr:trypsin-like peptidase domain-containing protein [Alicyclobacillaceae bacterium MYW30-H2]
MGFYNEDASKESRRSGRGKWIAAVVLSALVGSASTVAAVPIMIKSNFINLSQSSAAGAGSLTNPSVPVSNVSVKVNDGVVQAVNKVKSAIVGVANYGASANPYSQNSNIQMQGEGSGIIFDKQGYIVTNNHVVQGAAKVEVLLPNGKKTQAKVIGTDKYSDLAVLQIPSSYVTGVATFGNSDTLQVGEPAIAIGNPLGEEFNQTVTEGVISATKRMMPVMDEATGQTLNQQAVLQTDAAINPGNSGGALVNIEGQVIGINSSKIASTGVEGMGFAIPINEARPIIQEILKTGHVSYPALGIGAVDLAQVPNEYLPNLPVNYGVFVISVQSAQAKQSGLQKGDVIVAVNGDKITDAVSLHAALFKYKIGDTVNVTVYRGGNKQTMSVKLSALPGQSSTPKNATP